MTVRVLKGARELRVINEKQETVLCAPVALGWAPVGTKKREGDGKTPEGCYQICLMKDNGKYGPSLGLSYPNKCDATAARREGNIGKDAYKAILQAYRKALRPPWGTLLGGEIYIHAGGAGSDWTQGCIALEPEDMEKLYALRFEVDRVEILP